MTAEPDDPIDEAVRQWEAHGWGEAAPSMAATTTLVRVNQLLIGRIDHLLAPHGLTFARFEILRLLAFTRTGALPMGKLGALLQVHPASVTSAVARLEASDLVRRTPHPDDGRSTLAEILPPGREVVERATVDLNTFFRALGDPASNQRLRRALDQLSQRIEDTATGA